MIPVGSTLVSNAEAVVVGLVVLNCIRWMSVVSPVDVQPVPVNDGLLPNVVHQPNAHWTSPVDSENWIEVSLAVRCYPVDHRIGAPTPEELHLVAPSNQVDRGGGHVEDAEQSTLVTRQVQRAGEVTGVAWIQRSVVAGGDRPPRSSVSHGRGRRFFFCDLATSAKDGSCPARQQ